MTFPTVAAVFDEFTRADERPITGGSWQPEESNGTTNQLLGISSNQLIGPPTPAPATWGDQWWNETVGPDLESRVQVGVVMANGDQVYLLARLQNAGTTSVDGYYGYFARQAVSTAAKIYRLDNNTATELGATVLGMANSEIGDWFAFECEGSQLRCYRWNPATGWEQPIWAEDSTYPGAGTVALRVFDAMCVDTWICGTKIPQSDTSIRTRLQAVGRQARGVY